MDEYLSVKDVAALLRVSERTVARWVGRGRITPMRIGHTVRFEKRLLLRKLEQYEYGGDAKDDASLG